MRRFLSVLFLLLASTPLLARAEEPRPTLAVLGVKAGEGFSEREVATIEELLLGALQRPGRLKVTGRSDVSMLLGLEAQKQALGCDADVACLAELAGALGVQFVASADVGLIGETRVVALKVLEVASATSIARVRRTLPAAGDLVAAIDGVAGDAESAILQHLAGRASAKAPGLSPLKLGGIAGLVVGAGLGVAAGLLALGTRNAVADLGLNPRPGADVTRKMAEINAQADLATVLGVAAGVAGAVGLGLVVAF